MLIQLPIRGLRVKFAVTELSIYADYIKDSVEDVQMPLKRKWSLTLSKAWVVPS